MAIREPFVFVDVSGTADLATGQLALTQQSLQHLHGRAAALFEVAV